MSAIHELGNAVRTRRSTMGISQSSLARMSGLSRATVNGLEQGSVNDLSLLRAARLLHVLGLNVSVAPPRGPRPANATPAMQVAARAASTSFRTVMSTDELRRVFISDMPARAFEPHVRALLQEAPVSLLASLADELADADGIPPQVTWRRMRDVAAAVGAQRDLWE
ncbi:MAG: helix-turn-helix domain-containing protein [Burkholderiaceae bacterium]|nr:helix-turn-helix domain-containing protein [Burkholderiaceae bacterium]